MTSWESIMARITGSVVSNDLLSVRVPTKGIACVYVPDSSSISFSSVVRIPCIIFELFVVVARPVTVLDQKVLSETREL
jgi:hypothetical protein